MHAANWDKSLPGRGSLSSDMGQYLVCLSNINEADMDKVQWVWERE